MEEIRKQLCWLLLLPSWEIRWHISREIKYKNTIIKLCIAFLRCFVASSSSSSSLCIYFIICAWQCRKASEFSGKFAYFAPFGEQLTDLRCNNAITFLPRILSLFCIPIQSYAFDEFTHVLTRRSFLIKNICYTCMCIRTCMYECGFNLESCEFEFWLLLSKSIFKCTKHETVFLHSRNEGVVVVSLGSRFHCY